MGYWPHSAVNGDRTPLLPFLPVTALALVAPPLAAQDQFTITSAALGEVRLVNVHAPHGYDAVPAARFPVLYMPDGGLDEDFPHVIATVDSLVAAGAIRPVIVVGIPNTQRRRDAHAGCNPAQIPGTCPASVAGWLGAVS